WDFSLPPRPKISDPKIKIPEFGNPPVILGQLPSFASAVKTFESNFFVGGMEFHYLISAEFQKQGENKTYQGIYGFSY
ncbi:MAG: hypothetical protein V1705_01085, partial [bacterium]